MQDDRFNTKHHTFPAIMTEAFSDCKVSRISLVVKLGEITGAIVTTWFTDYNLNSFYT